MPGFGYGLKYLAGTSMCFLALGSQATFAQAPPTLEKISQSFQNAYNNKLYLEAGALGLYAISRGEKNSESFYNTACALSLAGDTNRAIEILERALKAGFEDANLMESDTDLKNLHSDRRWPNMVARIKKAAETRKKLLSEPERSSFNTSDIDRFWSAYDHALKVPPGAERAAVFQHEYFDRASEGMQDWIRVRRADAAGLAKFVTKNSKFFAAIRPAMLGIAGQRSATIAAFKKFKSLYPDAQFPGTTFCVGAFYGGGTTSNRNLLMSAEMYTYTPDTPKDELSRWQKTVLTPNTDIPFIIAHEMIHFQQRYPQFDGTLLRACIQEGSADFLGELCSGSVGQFHKENVYPWGEAHEQELWNRFQQDMNRTDKQTLWLYSESGEGKRPDDLGYFMGYKICEAYYKNARDKKQAIADILHIQDFNAFLKASRYAEKFPSAMP